MHTHRPTVGLFVTCLVDTMRPSVGFAPVELLQRAGCDVIVPAAQTCCGQPAINSGDNQDAKPIARAVMHAIAGAPAGAGGGTIKVHYPELFADEPRMASEGKRLAERTWELTSFLADVMKMRPDGETYRGVATYHDSCSGMRELGVKAQPRALLAGVAGLTLKELQTPEICCGFGGLFCVKYPEISEKMVNAKVDDVLATGADTLLGGDLGCLLNIAGRLSRRGAEVRVRHVAEVLAGSTTETPPIGSSTRDQEMPRRQP